MFIISKILLILPILSVFSVNQVMADDVYSEYTKQYEEPLINSKIQYRKLFKDYTIYIIPPTPKNNNEVDVGDYIDKEGLKKIEKRFEEYALKTGEPEPYIMDPTPIKNGELEYFEMPRDQALQGCHYPRGYTFPDFCEDIFNREIFVAGKDPQSKLDEIARSQGKVGEYNKVPPSYDPEGCQVDANGINHPCEEIKVVDLVSQIGKSGVDTKTAILP